MNRKYFWSIPECRKFRLVFEDAETVMGVNDENQHILFRKDTRKISFEEEDALRSSIAKIFVGETTDILIRKTEALAV